MKRRYVTQAQADEMRKNAPAMFEPGCPPENIADIIAALGDDAIEWYVVPDGDPRLDIAPISGAK